MMNGNGQDAQKTQVRQTILLHSQCSDLPNEITMSPEAGKWNRFDFTIVYPELPAQSLMTKKISDAIYNRTKKFLPSHPHPQLREAAIINLIRSLQLGRRAKHSCALRATNCDSASRGKI
ncbi:MAG: hypothetical protein H6623_07415 [Bdellovibrionaceae bacterium]|nr:hypothetical protein [Pseudobdellovibrionaceae bacterium]